MVSATTFRAVPFQAVGVYWSEPAHKCKQDSEEPERLEIVLPFPLVWLILLFTFFGGTFTTSHAQIYLKVLLPQVLLSHLLNSFFHH